MVLAEHPKLVMMDLYMPEMDGDEVCRRIRATPEVAKTPVVIVTQGGRDADLQRCRAAGCDDILLKPINRHLFVATARKFLTVADRSAPRVMAKLIVHFGVNPQVLLTDYSVNLSTGGVFLKTENPLPMDTPLTLEFSLPNLSVPVRCQGRVAWLNSSENVTKPLLPPGMGVQFLDLSLEVMYAIREFIKQQCLTPSW
jgi:uncharacterized protein (TIGR02266 family)